MINLIVQSSEEFRDSLPQTGLFEMFDCSVLIEASEFTPISEIEAISTLIHSAINVVDFKVSPLPLFDSDEIHISIAEVPLHIAENRKPKSPRPKKS